MTRCDTGSTRWASDIDTRRLLSARRMDQLGERGEHVAEDLIDRGSAAVSPRAKVLAVAGKAGLRRRQSPNERHRGCRSLFG
jgi:hypothetical protein